MHWPSFEGRSYGQTDRFSFRPLRLAIEAAGIRGPAAAIGSYQIAILDRPYRITENRGAVLCAESKLWLLAWAPNILSNGQVTGAWINLQLYRESESECPGSWGRWHWDGNIDKPTLSPSIGSPGMNETPPTGWHGYLQEGRWNGCI